MGNKFCKKRVDSAEGSTTGSNAGCVGGSGSKTPKTLNKIINKLNLKPKWKSDSNLGDKQTNSSTPISTIHVESKPLSRSTDWIDCSLEVAPITPPPEELRKESDTSKKSIFNDDTTPTPPPRQMKRVRRSLLDTVKDAFKTSTASTTTIAAAAAAAANNNNHGDESPEIEEQIMVKRTINYNCPCGGAHSRAQHEQHTTRTTAPVAESTQRARSIVVTSSNTSLPNYGDFRLSLPIKPGSFDDAHNSALSLPDENGKAKNAARRSLTTDLDAYLTRAKSIGSLIPSVLQRLSTNKAPLAEIESDDSLNSFNSMEDNWAGLTMIEHYEPKESSLPRPSKKTEADIIAELDGMIVDEAEAVVVQPPKPPARRTETLLKKMHKEQVRSSYTGTPPSTPEEVIQVRSASTIVYDREPKGSDHSPLMKILNQFNRESIEAAHAMNEAQRKSQLSPVHAPSPPRVQHINVNDFLAAERGAQDDLYKKERIAT